MAPARITWRNRIPARSAPAPDQAFLVLSFEARVQQAVMVGPNRAVLSTQRCPTTYRAAAKIYKQAQPGTSLSRSRSRRRWPRPPLAGLAFGQRRSFWASALPRRKGAPPISVGELTSKLGHPSSRGHVYAPRGAFAVSPVQPGGFAGRSLGLMADLEPKGEGDSSATVLFSALEAREMRHRRAHLGSQARGDGVGV